MKIFGQSNNSGELLINYTGDHSTGILEVCALEIHGGKVTLNSEIGQGIEIYGDCIIYTGIVKTSGSTNGLFAMGNLTIKKGSVNATATVGNAIQVLGGDFVIEDGEVTAKSTGTINVGKSGCGILVDDGSGNGNAKLTISGGKVVATGGDADTESAGAFGINVEGTLTISGTADVKATGGAKSSDYSGGFGILVKRGSEAGGDATISGGKVTAASGADNAAISADGDLTISDGEVTATGGLNGEGILTYGTATISGGTIKSTGGESSYGLEGTIVINGGNVIATGGAKAFESTFEIGTGVSVRSGADADNLGEAVEGPNDSVDTGDNKYAVITTED